jgi:hypothetical protein
VYCGKSLIKDPLVLSLKPPSPRRTAGEYTVGPLDSRAKRATS